MKTNLLLLINLIFFHINVQIAGCQDGSKQIFVDSIGTSYTATLTYGDDYKIFLGIPDDPLTNVYSWHKDGEPHSIVTGKDYLQLSMLQASDEGRYTCVVSNPDSIGNECYSRPVTIKLVGTCRERDSLALVAIYNSTNGQAWDSVWNLHQRMEKWYGVRMNQNACIEGLCMYGNGDFTTTGTEKPGNNLDGSLPPELGSLQDLKILQFQNNKIKGAIPIQFANAHNLLQLVMEANEISGTIPHEIHFFYNITIIRLFSNELTGPFPASISELQNLETLMIGRNLFNDTITTALCNLSKLKYLDLNNSGLIGKIPPCLGDLAALVRLRLESNQLSGLIPKQIGQLGQLEFLQLGYNKLDSVIPSELGNLYTLKRLELHGNLLFGSIPIELGALANLTHLHLDNNQLSEKIPSELENLQNLVELTFTNNKLNGEIPSELGNLLNLSILNLSNNQLSGEIPSELGNLLNLTTLNLSNNQISGKIPIELGNLPNLTILFINHNLLNSEIPFEIGNLIKLTNLRLNNNQLSGAIPTSLGKLLNISELSLYRNQLSGKVPIELENLIKLRFLIIHNNNLSGHIPSALGNLNNLESLDLHNNQLIGQIPSNLGQLVNLKKLYLNNNILSGCFPEEILKQCLLGYNGNGGGDGYSFSGNPGLPWGGDFERYCNGEVQFGAPCDDEDPLSHPDIITQECGCHGLTSLGYFLLGATTFCQGDSSEIKIIAGGGIEPFEIIWQGDTTSGGDLIIKMSSSGSYPLMIRDAEGNEVADTITFEMIPPIVLERVIEKKANRSLELILSGGTGNYTVQWSNGATGKKIFNLLPGFYSCIVTDDFGCSKSLGPFEIGKEFDDDNGGPGHTDVDPLIQPLIKGSVASQIDKITIPSYSSDSMSLTRVPFLSLSVHPNPTNGLIQVNMLLENEEDTDLIITDIMGTAIVKIRHHGGNVNSTIDLSNYPDGVYLLIFITDKKQIVHRLVKS